jgi:hypothetical protein
MNYNHTDPTLFDVQFRGIDGCAYGSKFILAKLSKVLFVLFTETKQNNNLIIIKENDFTQLQLDIWLGIIHSINLELDHDFCLIDHIHYNTMIEECCFSSTIILCRKYGLEDIEDILFDDHKTGDMGVFHQFGKNNIFDRMLEEYSYHARYKLTHEELLCLKKETLIVLFTKYDVEKEEEIPVSPYYEIRIWWINMYISGDPLIKDTYSDLDVMIAEDKTVPQLTTNGFLKLISSIPNCYSEHMIWTEYIRRRDVGREIYKTFSKIKKREIGKDLMNKL